MTLVKIDANVDRTFARMNGATENMELFESFTAPRATVAERLQAGKAMRTQVPRTSHARSRRLRTGPTQSPSSKQQNVTRVQKLVPVRFARMLASPFAFLRGSAAVMAADLSNTPVTGTCRQRLRRHARLQLRRLRLGRAQSRLRHQRFRRGSSRARGNGISKRLAASAAVAVRFMGGDKVKAADSGPRDRALLPQAHPPLTPTWAISRSGTTASTSGRCWTPCPPRRAGGAERMMDKAREKGHVQRAREADRAGRRRASHHRGSAADRARDAYGARNADQRRARRHAPLYIESLSHRPARSCFRAIASSIRRARSWASAASAPAAGWSCCRASTGRSAVPAGQAGTAHRSSRPMSMTSSASRTRAGGWSSASA